LISFFLIDQGSLVTCFDYNDLTSNFGPIAYHPCLNGVEPEGSQFRHAIRTIVSAIERAIGGKTFDTIYVVVDPELH
jgi:hypothetical protein